MLVKRQAALREYIEKMKDEYKFHSHDTVNYNLADFITNKERTAKASLVRRYAFVSKISLNNEIAGIRRTLPDHNMHLQQHEGKAESETDE